MIGSAMGYSTVIVMPNDQSKEKINTLKHEISCLNREGSYTDEKLYQT